MDLEMGDAKGCSPFLAAKFETVHLTQGKSIQKHMPVGLRVWVKNSQKSSLKF